MRRKGTLLHTDFLEILEKSKESGYKGNNIQLYERTSKLKLNDDGAFDNTFSSDDDSEKEKEIDYSYRNQ